MSTIIEEVSKENEISTAKLESFRKSILSLRPKKTKKEKNLNEYGCMERTEPEVYDELRSEYLISEVRQRNLKTLIFDHSWYGSGAPELVEAYKKIRGVEALSIECLITIFNDIPEVICTREDMFKAFDSINLKPLFSESEYPELCVVCSPKCIVHNKLIFSNTSLHLWLGIFEPTRPGDFNGIFSGTTLL